LSHPPHEGPHVEIVSAGNEVLIGDVLDTNSNWLCRRITALGGHMTRTAMVRDDPETIAVELRAALSRGPALLFTVGGLGPTPDDITLSGVALATGRPLELHPEAERMVRDKYAEFAAAGYVPSDEMNESRLKMARLPRGATPLPNPVGGAPGVLTRHEGCAVVSLPGVPEELRAIVDESMGELLQEIFGAAVYRERVLAVGLQDESAIAGILRDVADANPGVYVKSRAQCMGPDVTIHITLSARGESEGAIAALLDPPTAALVMQIAAAGFAITPSTEPV
jgi:nicotinamide-nucleotide amidase